MGTDDFGSDKYLLIWIFPAIFRALVRAEAAGAKVDLRVPSILEVSASASSGTRLQRGPLVHYKDVTYKGTSVEQICEETATDANTPYRREMLEIVSGSMVQDEWHYCRRFADAVDKCAPE